MELSFERSSLNPVARPGSSSTLASPRLFKLKQAAAYLNIPQAEVRRLGIGRVRLGTSERYDKNAIDAALDRLSGLDSTARVTTEDAEAALARFAQTL